MSERQTLLIVEDDPGFSSYLKRLLRHKDLHILTANRRQQAIQCLSVNSVDLVLQGIGLNIAQRIVADHNGSIILGNSRWGGAEFTIELPIERRMNTR